MTTKSITKNIDILSKVIVATLYYEFERFKTIDPNNTASHLQDLEYEKSRVYDLKKTNNIKELRKIYNRVIKVPTLSGDISFMDYLKNKTGIEIDLFGNIDERVDEIIKRGYIANKKEREDVCILNGINQKGNFELELHDKLGNLTFKYLNKINPKNRIPHIHHNAKAIYLEYSPDKKRKLVVSKGKLNDSQTIISIWIHSLNGGCLIFSSSVENQKVRATWKKWNFIEIQHSIRDPKAFKRDTIEIGDSVIKIKPSFKPIIE